ncbi:MAG: hypothetical protein LBP74_09400, partial [Treponema sp.]|nr:hypothetical protein [Treponema sp.]
YVSATDHFISLHTTEFAAALRGDRGMRTLIEGTRIQASFLLEAIRRPGLLDRIRAEHKAYRDSQKTVPTTP